MRRLPRGSQVTRNVAEGGSERIPSSQIEEAGGDDGIRTRDLMRDRHAF